MKRNAQSMMLAAALVIAGNVGQAQSVDSMPPVVVKTLPQSGDKDVAPGTVKLQVTFSKEMMDGSWSWSSAWGNSTPEVIGKPSYDTARRTCTITVKLEPGKSYGYWINSDRFKNFKDKGGKAAVPYLLVFETKK
jgi:hypothetical protein